MSASVIFEGSSLSISGLCVFLRNLKDILSMIGADVQSLASLGIVYYMRLNSEYRKEYEDEF